MIIEAIAIGLVYGFFLFEWTGLVAGGLVGRQHLRRRNCAAPRLLVDAPVRRRS